MYLMYYTNAGFLDDAGASLKGAENVMKQFAPIGMLVGAGMFLGGYAMKGGGPLPGLLLVLGAGLMAVGGYYILGNAANPLRANYANTIYPGTAYYRY